MTNPVNCQTQQPPSYSGVTINITNPAMTVPPQYAPYREWTVYAAGQPVAQRPVQYINKGEYLEPVNRSSGTNIYQSENTENQQIPQAYPQQYYINNYNTQNPEQGVNNQAQESQQNSVQTKQNSAATEAPYGQPQVMIYNPDVQPNGTQQSVAADSTPQQADAVTDSGIAGAGTVQAVQNRIQQGEDAEIIDTSTSKEIIEELDQRNAEEKELEKNGKKTKVTALTNEYIMSLENYLNNPNTDIRLMAAKEVLTRLDEDKSRYDDAALNALINKMLQDPSKLVRIAAMSALSSELASGNEYTVQLLNQIQQNPEGDPEDVLEASQILLKRTAATEIKYTPVQTQQNQQTQEAEE